MTAVRKADFFALCEMNRCKIICSSFMEDPHMQHCVLMYKIYTLLRDLSIIGKKEIPVKPVQHRSLQVVFNDIPVVKHVVLLHPLASKLS